MSETRLFGTDGIRGTAGRYPLDRPTIERVGFAIATCLVSSGKTPRVVVGRDPRESGVEIEEALLRGLLAARVSVVSGGVMTTPEVALLARSGGFDAGVVISASHNPYHDNGIKLFSGEGLKFPESFERQVEAIALESDPEDIVVPDRPVPVYRRGSDPLLRNRYLSFLMAVLPRGFSLEGRRVLLDCANGAASELAPEVFRRLGAEVQAIECAPDGRNINSGAGALHPERLADEVKKHGAWLGAAYDGDADRCILVDDTGTVRDGDDILAVAAAQMLAAGTLGQAGVVLTVMANFGLEAYLSGLGIPLVRTPVGDRHVLQEMIRRDAMLGGEQSGHIIFRDAATTGDGILTSLRMAHFVALSGEPLSGLCRHWSRMPQLLRNVRVRERVDLLARPEIAGPIAAAESRLHGRGRVLVRYSGTEPLVRIMLEGEDASEIEAMAGAIATAVEQSIGA